MSAKPFRTQERLRLDDPPFGDRREASSGALRNVDRALRELVGRRLVSSGEVVDLLLDLRSAITLDAALEELSDEWRCTDVPASCRGR